MGRVNSAKGTVIFDDECGEYDFVKAAADDESLMIMFEAHVDMVNPADAERAEQVGAEIYADMCELAADEIPYPGVARSLLLGYLGSLDWAEIGIYYIEHFEAKGQ